MAMKEYDEKAINLQLGDAKLDVQAELANPHSLRREGIDAAVAYLQSKQAVEAKQQKATQLKTQFDNLQQRIADYKEAKAEQAQKGRTIKATDPAERARLEEEEAELEKETEKFEQLQPEWEALNQEMLLLTPQLTLAQQDLAKALNKKGELNEKQYQERCQTLATGMGTLMTQLEAEFAEIFGLSPEATAEQLQSMQQIDTKAWENEMQANPELSYDMPPLQPTLTVPTPRPKLDDKTLDETLQDKLDQTRELSEDKSMQPGLAPTPQPTPTPQLTDEAWEKALQDKLDKRKDYLQDKVLTHCKQHAPEMQQEQLDRLTATIGKTFQGAFNMHFSAMTRHGVANRSMHNICRNEFNKVQSLENRLGAIYKQTEQLEHQFELRQGTAPVPMPGLQKKLEEQQQLLAQPQLAPELNPQTAPTPRPPGAAPAA